MVRTRIAAFATAAGRCKVVHGVRQLSRKPLDGMEQMRIAAFLIVLLTPLAARSAPGSCSESGGFVYSENHSFKVSAPDGWCCTLSERSFLCSPTGGAESVRAVSLETSFSYLRSSGSSATAIESELHNLAAGGTIAEGKTIPTNRDGSVRTWSVSGADLAHQLLVGYLARELVLVRFILKAPSAEAVAASTPAFEHMAASLRGRP